MDKALKSVLQWWEAAGVDVPDVSTATPRKKTDPAPLNTAEKQTTSSISSAPGKTVKDGLQADIAQIIEKARAAASKAKTLEELKAAMDKFDAGLLSDRARQCVFSRGNPASDVMVIGEAPGRDEDVTGKPFVGRSGQLLDRMLASIGLIEETFYITNIVNWRPPKNRNPKPEEIEICRPFLNRHIELADPKVILIVGGVSLLAMTGIKGIMKNRGQWQTMTIGDKDIPALPIYHPAFLLRQPALKKDAWRDLLTLRGRLSGELG